MKERTYTAQEWLKHVDKDQNIVGLENIEATLKNEAFRQWFFSQLLNGTFNMGHYDTTDGRLRLGTQIPRTATTVSSVLNTPSVTLTCPAGHAYKVILVCGDNDTTAATWRVIYTPSGGTALQIIDSGTFVSAVNTTCTLIGGTGGITTTATQGLGSFVGPIWMRPGDTLNVENTNDQAGDTITIAFLYEDYVI